jgi:hypothetical protein
MQIIKEEGIDLLLFNNKPIIMSIGYYKGARRRKYIRATWDMSIIR